MLVNSKRMSSMPSCAHLTQLDRLSWQLFFLSSDDQFRTSRMINCLCYMRRASVLLIMLHVFCNVSKGMVIDLSVRELVVLWLQQGCINLVFKACPRCRLYGFRFSHGSLLLIFVAGAVVDSNRWELAVCWTYSSRATSRCVDMRGQRQDQLDPLSSANSGKCFLSWLLPASLRSWYSLGACIALILLVWWYSSIVSLFRDERNHEVSCVMVFPWL